MSEIKQNVWYSKDHEWAEIVDANTIRVGISYFAQSQLGDIVFVELPEIGLSVKDSESLGTIESVKTVSDVFSPVAGTVTKVNSDLLDQPELVNNEPYGQGWMVELEVEGGAEAAVAGLLTGDEYKAYTEE
ncbi:glycine cleavage system protein GcvH [Paenibacillus sp. N1-5-1-14]|uniref:glycine cleavage system protein GcvH n=1 Tax=Paenibacillus radicibacter TaxID=2972488 RepID=UPI0021598621|nr:glycine cleavage system protein GcvH [Paenibacillus radicibacter]MCR8643514.1 glycine cleavage system protein GcvH [Paenibacillus radicibacter]